MTAITGNGTAQTGLGGAAGFGEMALTRADDGSFAIDTSAVFENGLTVAGVTYAANALFVSLDGFLTFGTGAVGLPSSPTTQLTTPFIAAFMADIDVRLDGEGAESGLVWIDIDPIMDVVTITWQDVGFYRRNADLTNTFQIQLFDQGAQGIEVALRYQSIEWTSGDLQGGWGGNSGTPAYLGHRWNAWGAATLLPASGNESLLLNLPTTLGNTGVTGLWVWTVPLLALGVGTADEDVLIGGIDVDRLIGLGGDDTLSGGLGADTLDGGDGFDWTSYSNASAGLFFSFANPSLNTNEAAGDILISIEGVIGSAFGDTLMGGAAPEVLRGGDGADSLFGQAGADTLLGDAGDDTLEGGLGADTLTGGAGLDMVSYSGALTALRVSLADISQNTAEAAGDVFVDIEGVLGSALNDTIFGSAGADRLDGNAGNDSLIGQDSADTLIGGAGDDTMDGGAGGDSFFGGAGNDVVSYVTSDRGVVIDLANPSQSSYWAQGDRFSGVERVIGSNFSDLLWGDGGANQLDGGIGEDCLFGGAGADTLTGGWGRDVLFGDDGADVLDGGVGADLLEGGVGADRFQHSGMAGDGTDWIIDFTSNSGDVLVFTGAGASLTDFSITSEQRARLWVLADDVWVVTHIPTGRQLWVLENSENTVTDVDISINNVMYDLL